MNSRSAFASLALTALLVGATPSTVFAHCDSLDGPVVKAAQRALETRDLALVLIWVPASDETEISTAFERTLNVRALGSQARELADRFFFETVVRIHRMGEGEPFTGLRPTGYKPGPAIVAADKAIDTQTLAPVVSLLSAEMRESAITGAEPAHAGERAAAARR